MSKFDFGLDYGVVGLSALAASFLILAIVAHWREWSGVRNALISWGIWLPIALIQFHEGGTFRIILGVILITVAIIQSFIYWNDN